MKADCTKTANYINKILFKYSERSSHLELKNEDQYTSRWRYKRKTLGDFKFAYDIVVPKIESIPWQEIQVYKTDIFINIFKCKNVSLISHVLSQTQFYEYLTNLFSYRSYLKDELLDKPLIKKYYQSREYEMVNDVDLDDDASTCLDILNQWTDNSSTPLLILGDRGIGKTWLVKKYCIDQLKKHNLNPWLNPIPILINMGYLSKGMDQIYSSFDLIRFHLSEKYKIEPFDDGQILEILLEQNNIVLVLDGMDEMSEVYDQGILEKNIWELSRWVNRSSKVIISSRLGIFNSEEYLQKYFANDTYLEKYVDSITEYVPEVQAIRRNYNIFEMLPLSQEKVENLNSILFKESNTSLGAEKISKIGKAYSLPGKMQYELYTLHNINPNLQLYVTALLGSNDYSLLQIFEMSIRLVIIEFNIQSERGISQYHILNKNRSISSMTFKYEEKYNLLTHIAWYLYERNIQALSLQEFKEFLTNQPDVNYNTVLNDILTQTVLTLDKDKGKYRFHSEGTLCYFIAKNIMNSLTPELSNVSSTSIIDTRGIKKIGTYPLYNSYEGRILVFLKGMIDERSRDEPNFKKKLSSTFINELSQDSIISPWFKYIHRNFLELEINLPKSHLYEFWELSEKMHKDVFSLGVELVLIPDAERSFYISVTEVTNIQFLQFLSSTREEAELLGPDGYLPRQALDGSKWLRSKRKDEDNPFSDIINEYHLIDWQNDFYPNGHHSHPLVWISWFTAAAFCNWLSILSGCSPYYLFEPDHEDGEKIVVNKNQISDGFRLPTKDEWAFVASELGRNKQYVWDSYEADGSSQSEGIQLKTRLKAERNSSYSVKAENPNILGVYGLMGNVREWVDDSDISIITSTTKQYIKGAAWLTTREGLNFNYSQKLLAQNTNPDVGFRIVKNISSAELKLLGELI